MILIAIRRWRPKGTTLAIEEKVAKRVGKEVLYRAMFFLVQVYSYGFFFPFSKCPDF